METLILTVGIGIVGFAIGAIIVVLINKRSVNSAENRAKEVIDKSKKENQKLSGKVSWISSQAEFTPKIIQTKEERVNMVYAVKIRVKNDGSLKIGMPGEANF